MRAHGGRNWTLENIGEREAIFSLATQYRPTAGANRDKWNRGHNQRITELHYKVKMQQLLPWKP